MTLPIQLDLGEVELPTGETGTRWTLGPYWYEEHQYDYEYEEGVVPFYDHEDIGEADPNVAPGPVKTWAERIIPETTAYRVVGWNGLIPDLVKEVHVLEIWTSAGASMRMMYQVDGRKVPSMLRSLGNPNEVLVINRPERSTAYVPVRAITTIKHLIIMEQVTNTFPIPGKNR